MKYQKIILLVLGVVAVIGISFYLKKQDENSRFTVSLEENNKIIFSDKDIVSLGYDQLTASFVLTKKGVEKVASYQELNEEGFPISGAGLHQKTFIARLGSEELYKGKFWSQLHLGDGILIFDPNSLTVSEYDKPGSELAKTLAILIISENVSDSLDMKQKISSPKIVEHFKKIGKLKNEPPLSEEETQESNNKTLNEKSTKITQEIPQNNSSVNYKNDSIPINHKLSILILDNKQTYKPGENISLRLKGTVADGNKGSRAEGFNVQVYLEDASTGDDFYTGIAVGDNSNANALYDEATGYWYYSGVAPTDSSKTYRIRAGFYCSTPNSVCSKNYVSSRDGGNNGQVEKTAYFTVSLN